MFHAVVQLDQQHAQVLHFDAHQVHAARIEPQDRRAQPGDDEHALFAAVCQAVQDTREVLVTGACATLNEFRGYVEAHRPRLVNHIADYRPAAPLSQGQMLALARQFFVSYDRKAGLPTPG